MVWLTAGSEIDLSYAIEVISKKDRERVVKAIQEVLVNSSSEKYDIEYGITNPITGFERAVHAKGKVWFGPDQIAYRFNGTLQDVTQQVAAKEQLEEIAERMQLAIDAGNLGSYEFIIETGEIVATPQCKLHLGMDTAEPLTFSKLISLILPPDREAMQIAVGTALRERSTYNSDYRVTAPDGAIKWVRAAGNPVFDDLGAPVKMVGITLDITEQMEFAEELSKQVAERTVELQRSNEDLLQFAHVTSHDLKEPIRKIRIFANRIQDELHAILPEKGVRYLDKIQNASSRVMSMIEGVLAYSELNAVKLQIETVDLNKVIADVETDLEILIQEKNALINKDILPQIEGTSVLLYQLFYNILNNALKFSSTDKKAEIHISHQITPGPEPLLEVMIGDNGIGFDNEYHSRIFTTFARLNSKDAYEGTGLGLALCKKIVQRHHGSIAATGELGNGSLFKVTLPLRQKNEDI